MAATTKVRSPDKEMTYVERAYRRGVHQAAARLADLIASRTSDAKALDLARRFEAEAARFRHAEADPGGFALLDEIATRLD
jgi:hypothetical protein